VVVARDAALCNGDVVVVVSEGGNVVPCADEARGHGLDLGMGMGMEMGMEETERSLA
jgi:hypothetical protein